MTKHQNQDFLIKFSSAPRSLWLPAPWLTSPSPQSCSQEDGRIIFSPHHREGIHPRRVLAPVSTHERPHPVGETGGKEVTAERPKLRLSI